MSEKTTCKFIVLAVPDVSVKEIGRFDAGNVGCVPVPVQVNTVPVPVNTMLPVDRVMAFVPVNVENVNVPQVSVLAPSARVPSEIENALHVKASARLRTAVEELVATVAVAKESPLVVSVALPVGLNETVPVTEKVIPETNVALPKMFILLSPA